MLCVDLRPRVTRLIGAAHPKLRGIVVGEFMEGADWKTLAQSECLLLFASARFAISPTICRNSNSIGESTDWLNASPSSICPATFA